MSFPGPQAPRPRGMSPGLKWALGGCATVVVIGSLVVMVSVARWCGRSTELSGVIMGTQVPPAITAGLRGRGLLGPTEELLAYYDASMSLDGSEISFVTRDRIVYARGGQTVAMPLAEVDEVTHRSETLAEIIEVRTTQLQRMKIELAALNDGAAFLRVLEDAWKAKRPGAAIKKLP
jgi:hypothetical protein